MFNLTEELLEQSIMPTLFNDFKAASELLANFNMEGTDEEAEYYLLSADDNISLEAKIDTVTSIYQNALDVIIKDFGIFIHEGVALHQMNNLIYSLVYLEDSEDMDYVKEICKNEDMDNLTKIIEIISLAGFFDVDELYFIIESVNESTIELLKTRDSVTVESFKDEVATQMEQEIVQGIKKASKVLNSRIYAFEVIRADGALGLPFEQYLNLFKSQMYEYEHEYADNLLVFALMSSDGYRNPLKILNDYKTSIELDEIKCQEILESAKILHSKVVEQ